MPMDQTRITRALRRAELDYQAMLTARGCPQVKRLFRRARKRYVAAGRAYRAVTDGGRRAIREAEMQMADTSATAFRALYSTKAKRCGIAPKR